jgi:two-component system, cell cycle sensor histidine kinase and response regulator CckA
VVVEGVARDITESHEREQLQEQLHQAKKMEAVGQLAGGIAHDFNNLLQVIQGHTQLVRAINQDRKADALLQGVLGAAERASSLVKQLLTFSRKGSVELAELELGQLLLALHQMLERVMGDQVRLIWECSVGPVHVLGNAAQIEQLVANLCINARDAMPRGGSVHVTLDVVLPHELPAAARAQSIPAAAEYVRLTIRDEGEGMSPEVQSRLFEPFFTTKGPGKGTGLGLSTTYATVRAHRGYIEVASGLGQGSTFRIFLPRVPATPRRHGLQRSTRRISGKGHLALTAEDEPEVLRLTATYLMQAGFDVLTAPDGEQAEKLLIEGGSTVTVAVLDMVMPKRGGLAVYETLRDLGISTPIVFVTGYDDELLGATATQKDVTILRKPFTKAELLAKVALVVGERIVTI